MAGSGLVASVELPSTDTRVSVAVDCAAVASVAAKIWNALLPVLTTSVCAMR